jgi:hypothetical protein
MPFLRFDQTECSKRTESHNPALAHLPVHRAPHGFAPAQWSPRVNDSSASAAAVGDELRNSAVARAHSASHSLLKTGVRRP